MTKKPSPKNQSHEGAPTQPHQESAPVEPAPSATDVSLEGDVNAAIMSRMRIAMEASVGENHHENMAEMEDDPEQWDSVLEAGCDGFEDGWNAALRTLATVLNELQAGRAQRGS